MKHVFISYQHEDGDFADLLISKVKEAGYSTWIDNDQMQPGTDWRESIDRAIKESCALIVIMSPAAKASEYVTYEWAFAWGAGVKVIPIVYKQTSLHPRLETLHYLNFISRIARPWEKLLENLKQVAYLSATMPQPQAPLISNTSHERLMQLLQNGDIFYEVEEYDNALSAYEEVLHLEPDNAVAHKKKGDTLARLRQYRDALISYKRATYLQPEFVEAYIAQCIPLRNLKRPKDAFALCEQALRLDSENAEAYNNKGFILYDLKRYEEALEAFDQALRLDSENAEAYNNKGFILYDLERYEEALEAFDQALRLDPSNVKIYNKKGYALLKLENHREASVAFQQAQAIDPENQVAKFGMIFVFKIKQFICPYCDTSIKSEDILCVNCGKWLDVPVVPKLE